jgi:hypothetical protein
MKALVGIIVISLLTLSCAGYLYVVVITPATKHINYDA